MSHGVIGFDAYEGLFTKAQYQAGKGRTPGSRVTVKKGGDSKEFVAVKLAAGTWSNGCVVQLNSAGVAGTATTVSVGANIADHGQRLGLLTFSSVSALQTMAGTAFGYAQVYGIGGAQVSSVTVAGAALDVIASAGILGAFGVQATASVVIIGINLGATTASVQAFVPVFLTYPRFQIGGKDD